MPCCAGYTGHAVSFHQALTDFVEISGATGASLSSRTGNVRLHSNNGSSSLLVGTDNILAMAETVTLRGSRGPASSWTSSTEAHPSRGGEARGGEPRGSRGSDDFSGGGFLTLTSEFATLGSPSGASLDVADEVRRYHWNSILRPSSRLWKLVLQRGRSKRRCASLADVSVKYTLVCFCVDGSLALSIHLLKSGFSRGGRDVLASLFTQVLPEVPLPDNL